MSRRDSQPPPAIARATALWQQRRLEEALAAFEEAIREAPQDSSVLIDAARAFGATYQTARCMELLARAQDHGARQSEIQQAVGDSYRMLGRFEPAEACYRAAIALAATPAMQFELAKICERRHALVEAAELVEKVLRAEPGWPAALLLRARLQQRQGETEAARTTLEQLIAAGPQPKLLAEAYGELATLQDSSGEYDTAWESILNCKRILLENDAAAWNASQVVTSRCRQMIDALTPEHFRRWQGDGSPDSRPIALLTGFPRTGTTLLEQVLEAHPGVISAEETEIFSREVFTNLTANQPVDAPIEQTLDGLSARQLEAARQMYFQFTEAVLGEPTGARLLVDKNPAMVLMIPTVRRVFPQSKLLVALRDPRDVVVSCFLRYLPVNPVSVNFLTLERLADRYALDMGAWLKLREMIQNWLEVRYEDVVANLEAEARRTIEFLELPWNDAVLDYRRRGEGAIVRSPSYVEVARPVFTTSIGRWQNYQRQLEPILARLAPIVKALGYDR